MKPRINPFVRSAALAAFSIALTGIAYSATVTWVGDVDNAFMAGANWSTDPALPSLSADTWQVNGVGSVNTNATLNLGSALTFAGTAGKIAFGASSGNMGLSGSDITLFQGTGDGILTASSGTTTIANNIIIGNGSTATNSLSNSNITGGLLKVTGNITNGTGGTAGAVVLSFGSTSTQNGNYEVTGNITRSSGATTLGVTKRGSGILTLSGTNTIDSLVFGTTAASGDLTGSVRINGGTTNLNAVDGSGGWGAGSATNTVQISSGILNSTAGRAIKTSILVDGGTLNFNTGASRIAFATAGNPSFTMSSGAVNFNPTTGTFGIRFGGDNGAGSAGAALTGIQSGGIFTVNGAGAQDTTFSLGSTTGSIVTSYSLSGGTLEVKGTGNNGWVTLGADAAGTSTTTFTLSGTGKLISNFAPGTTGGINGRTASAAQVLALQGGTLVAGRIEAANLRGSAGGTNGTIVNNGSNIAPGDIGTAGRTTINGGNLTINSGTLSIDLGGTTAATAFQGAAGEYDNLSVTGSTSLAGRLSFNLTNSYSPLAATNHNIIVGTTAGATGNFTNQVVAASGNQRVVGADGLSSFLIATNTTGSAATVGGLTSVAARTTAVGGYQATNTYSGAGTAWDTGSAGAWTNFDAGATATPATQASGAIAQFADGTESTGAIGVSLNSTRNIQGVQFSSAAGSRAYTINNGGSGAIILDNTANSASATIADSSTSGTANAINVGITLNSDLAVSVTNAANTLTIGGAIGGSGKSLTKTGVGNLALTGANSYSGASIVTAGKLVVGGASGTLSASDVTVTGSGTILASGIANTIGKTLSVGNGAILAAGDAGVAGTATVTNASTFNNGSIFSWDVNATGVSYDKLITSGLVDGDAVGGSVFRVVLADTTLADAFWNTTQTWTNLFTNNGSTAIANWATIFSSVTVVDSAFATFDPSAKGAFTASGNTLTWSAVPEPTSALAGLLIAAGLLRRRRSA